MHPFIGRLFVNFVLCLICFIAYSSQIFIIWPWYGNVLSVELLYLLVPFNILVGLLLWNYFLSVYTDPGRVPIGWTPDTHEDGLEVKRLTGRPRHCRMCENYKPPRAHHCRQCNRCVLRMDHHCPWINNCVGHFNYAHFIRFLFYVDVACSYHFAMVTKRVLYVMAAQYWDDPSSTELVMIILNYVACIPVLLAVGCFSLYHIYCLLRNSTTIEGWEKNKAALMVKKGKLHTVKFPYDLGMRRNIETVLGPNPLFWCWPRPPLGNGLRYELSKQDVGEVWPPQTPSSSSANSVDYRTTSASPWVFKSEGLNPSLVPSNTAIRQSTASARRRQRDIAHTNSSISPVPPDYGDVDRPHYGEETDSSDGEAVANGKAHVRQGSEGYEVRSQDREEMLRRYLEELGEKPGRYKRYIPQPDDDGEEDTEDDLPLSHIAVRSFADDANANVGGGQI